MRLIVAVIIFVGLHSVAWAEKRVALVFGADRYEAIRPLHNAVNDAREIEHRLDTLGFEVFVETNRNLKRMRRALDDFVEDAAGADVALVFFAGHGVEIAGENRLLPTDADAAKLDALRTTSLPLEELRQTVTKVAKIGLIVLDACRNDPFATLSDPKGRGATALKLPKTVKPGLGRVGRAENTLFAFAAAPGETAADGEGSNSPFTTALTKYLGTEGLEIRSVLTLVQQEVYERSGGKQLPYVESGLPQLFFASETSQELPERERLLLAMADVTPSIRDQVERVATDTDMPLAPLYGALIGSDLANQNWENRQSKLEEAATAFVKVRDELRTLRSDDERVTKLRLEAEEQLLLGAFETARARLTEAANIDATSRETLKANLIERTLSEAATHYLNGSAARAELKYQLAIEDLARAVALFDEVDAQDMPPDGQQRQFQALEALGDIWTTVGSLENANSAYERYLSAVKHLANSDPANLVWQRHLSGAHSNLADVRTEQGDLEGALEAFEISLTNAVRLVEIDPANTIWQRDLAVSHDKIGNVRVLRGDLAGALEAFDASFEITKRLVAADPTNDLWQQDLLISQVNIGDVRANQGDLEGALEAYHASLNIAEGLVVAYPSNAKLQRSLSVSHNRIGEVLIAEGNLDGALGAFKEGLLIRQRLALADASNTRAQRDISVNNGRIGYVLRAMDDLDGALAAYQTSLSIRERLAAADPSNAGWQRDLSVSLENIGDIRKAQRDFVGALDAHQKRNAIAKRLAMSDPSNIVWQRDLSVSYNKIGDVYKAQGDADGAMNAYEAGLSIAESVAAADPTNAGWQWDLFVSYWRIANSTGKKSEYFEKALMVLENLHAEGRLAPDKVKWIKITRQRLAEAEAAQ